MPKTIIEWKWEEAFDKFGFGDGDSWNGTRLVQDRLEELGYAVEADTAGMHNYCIHTLSKGEERWEFDGYQGPREILPQEVVQALDDTFHINYEYEEG